LSFGDSILGDSKKVVDAAQAIAERMHSESLPTSWADKAEKTSTDRNDG
jgi:hypothetical protein